MPSYRNRPGLAAFDRALAAGELEALRSALFALSPEEREILAACADGLSSTELARRLWLSEGSVRNRVSEILGKLGVRSRAEAVQIGRENGWI